MLHENLTCKNHIELIENKTSENIGTYIKYANVAWASTNQTKLKKLYNKQKHAS